MPKLEFSVVEFSEGQGKKLACGKFLLKKTVEN